MDGAILLAEACGRRLRPDRHFDTIAGAASAALGGAEALARLEGGEACGCLDEAGFRAVAQAAGEDGPASGGAPGEGGGAGTPVAGGMRAAWTIRTAVDGRVQARDVRALLSSGQASGSGAASSGAAGAPPASGAALAVILNGHAGPYLCRPLAMGADVVVEDAWLAGLPGAACAHGARLFVARTQRAAEEFAERVRAAAGPDSCGALPAPLDKALACGLPTLSLRTQRRCDTALAVAHYLALHPLVAWASYPGLPDDPSNDPARRSLEHGFGPLVSFGVRAGRLAAGAPDGEGLAARAPGDADARPALADGARPVSAAGLGALSRVRRGPVAGTYLVECGLEDALDVVEALERLLGPVAEA